MPADTPELNAQEQLLEIRKQYRGTDKWLKAPNGKKSNLNEKQWLQVRTPNFKRWFGNWENDPENASKVIDENGEPLVVYHRTKKGNNFDVFETYSGAHFGTREQADARANGKLYPVYLNIKNPERTTDQGVNWNYEVKYAKLRGADGLVYENEVEGNGDSWVVFSPEQIKSSTKNRGNFNQSDPNIYHQALTSKRKIQEQIDEVKTKYEGTDKWLKAPNGKKTKLNIGQWLDFRTKNFKNFSATGKTSGGES